MAILEVKSQGGTRFRVQVYRGAESRISKTFRRRTDAVAWEKKTEAEIVRGEYQAEAEQRTLADLAERYRAHLQATARSNDKGSAQLSWWTARIGGLKLAKVTPARIAELRDKLALGDTPSGRPASPATVNRYLAALRECLSYSVKELGWLAANPVSRVTKRTEPPGRVRYLDRDAELPALLTACRQSTEPRLLPLVLLALATAARQGELLGLKWQDVDEQRGLAVLHETKNGSRRALALSAPAREALSLLRRVRVLGSAHLFATSAHSGKPPAFDGLLRLAWERALRETGITDFHFHDLRHTAASYAAMTGATLPELAALLGHKTLAMVQRYAHLSPGHMQAVAERMADKFLSGALAAAQ